MSSGARVFSWLVGLSILLLVADAAAERPVVRFAVVIGNNHSERSDTRSLRYADDDAVAMHQLLDEAGVESALFVNLDSESRNLYPGLAASGRPRWSALRARLARLEDRIRAAERAGAATTLLLFYSGHGDVAHGEGYVELEDARLTRTLLRREILERTSADEVHLVIDACRSYFLAFEKGAGGKRRRAAAAPLVDSGRTRARTGYILSTSSDRDSHEWEAFQGGIFSHEVRSALRGAADADQDGSVTYAELGAFLTVANGGIRNARFRPDFVVRPPGDLSDELLRWQGRGAQTLLLDRPEQGHMILEGPTGERLLDVHPAEGQELLLRLPARRPLFLRQSGGDREFAITEPDGDLRLSALSDGRVRVASKGALHLAFRQLFSSPFSGLDVARYRHAVMSSSVVMGERARARADVAAERDTGGGRVVMRRIAGVTAIAAGVAAAGLGGWAIERSIAAESADQVRRESLNGTVEDARTAAGISLGVAAGTALVYWLLRDGDDDESGRLTLSPTTGVNGMAVSGAW
ncbi:MAG TPA: caspase family protein [Kofleriaceae bacterium]|nr:caspase family protein [Kofleriaceae bacterium]